MENTSSTETHPKSGCKKWVFLVLAIIILYFPISYLYNNYTYSTYTYSQGSKQILSFKHLHKYSHRLDQSFKNQEKSDDVIWIGEGNPDLSFESTAKDLYTLKISIYNKDNPSYLSTFDKYISKFDFDHPNQMFEKENITVSGHQALSYIWDGGTNDLVVITPDYLIHLTNYRSYKDEADKIISALKIY